MPRFVEILRRKRVLPFATDDIVKAHPSNVHSSRIRMMRSQRGRTLVVLMAAAIGCVAGCARKEKVAAVLNEHWISKADSLNKGIEEQWFRIGVDRSSWNSREIGDERLVSGPPAPSGARWYATQLNIESPSKPLALFLGAVEDELDVWLDGTMIGSAVCHADPCSFDIPTEIRPGKKELVVRVSDNGTMAELHAPVNLVPKDRLLELYKTDYSRETARPSEDWIRDAVVYEVFLRSFSHQGGAKVLEHRLSELKDLGATTLCLMPIHPVGELNRKGTLGSPYSVQDYYAINPQYGSLEDFKSLVKAVHALGMRIVIDLVAAHTAWDSRLVMEHPEWFVKNEEGAITSPNPVWSDVAKLNYGHHELRKYMIDMMKYWVRDVGIDGYRCDAADMVPTDFWEHARFELDKIRPVMMLSEGTLPQHHVGAFDLTYSWTFYDLLAKVIDGTTQVEAFDDLVKIEGYQFPKGSLRLRFNTNHDKNVWDAPAVMKFSPKGARTTAVLSFTYPGVPLIYNGEEAGNQKSLSLFEKVDIDWTKNIEFRAFYQALTQLRSAHIALRRGEYVPVSNTGGGKVFSFIRKLGDDQVLVVLNLSHGQHTCEIAVPTFKTSDFLEYFTKTEISSIKGHLSIEMKDLDYKIFLPLLSAGKSKQ